VTQLAWLIQQLVGCLVAACGAVLMMADAASAATLVSHSTGITTISAEIYTYDAPAVAYVDVRACDSLDVAENELVATQIGSASPSVEARPTSTTPSVTFIATEAVPPRFIPTGAGTTIDRASVGTAISAQRQGRHLAGAAQYNGGGYFNSLDDAQSVLDAFHSGSAQVLGTTRSGNIVVRVPGVTGFNNNPAAGFVDQATDVFFIKGSSSVSVVPASPNWVAG
jgi:hypothetical protein